MKIKYNLQIESYVRPFYRRNFKAMHGGISFVTQSFPICYKAALHELRGIFHEHELFYCVKLLHAAHVRYPLPTGNTLEDIINQEDWCNENGPTIDPKRRSMTLIKLKALTVFNRVSLEVYLTKLSLVYSDNLEEENAAFMADLKALNTFQGQQLK